MSPSEHRGPAIAHNLALGAAVATKGMCPVSGSITIVDIRTEDGNQVLIELSDGRIILLTVTEILKAISAQEAN